ncbi:hypothetical protein VNI00_019153 [Paramarasmius palmivorus]|uniref:N-acetyltransferase domain-containing protein n=1 Tax=Paramarasmius palmivorus TaxID=297713 RepID=A0AAW0AQD4_9AGAR
MFSSSKDTNFCFPIPDILQTDRVKLVPFIPSQHTSTIHTGLNSSPEITQYIPIGPYTSPEELVEEYWEKRVKPNPGYTVFVVYDTTSPSPSQHQPQEAAGFVLLCNCSPEHLLAEIGIVTFKAFQRTHVSSHAVGLLMRYALDLPDQGGLGLRRIQWQTNELNEASVGLALKMGFVKEGVLRWCQVLDPIKSVAMERHRERKGDPREGCPGGDVVVLATYWDVWEDGLREKVERMLR